jgi:hypothetical protein
MIETKTIETLLNEFQDFELNFVFIIIIFLFTSLQDFFHQIQTLDYLILLSVYNN